MYYEIPLLYKKINKGIFMSDARRFSYAISFDATKDRASSQPGLLVYPVFDLGDHQQTCTGGPVAYMPDDSTLFSGKRGQTLPVIVNGKTILLLGLGSPKTLNALACEEIGGALQQALTKQGNAHVIVNPAKNPNLAKGLDNETFAAHLASGILLKGYSFTKYKTADNDNKAKDISISFTVVNKGRAEAAYAPLHAAAQGVFLARDLANEPPNVAYPEAVADMICNAFPENDSTVHVKFFSAGALSDMKAGGILAVGQGSSRPPCMVVMEYDGTNGKHKRPDLALVGKGVTFDTGGISIKPSANMQDMKYDMCGAADVVGTMLALSKRKANTHVVGIVGLAENMPGPNAYRPGDVIRLMSGKTVEITNTDAEGRLVLSDCLTYIEKTYKPKAIIDLATLTGACVAALGHTFAAVLTRDEKLEKNIIKAGRSVDELCHPMPLHDVFTQAVCGSKIADLNNSVAGPGTSTAGAFLEQAILNKTPWAHLDIAGMAWNAPGKLSPADGTASGFGVRLLDRLVHNNFEQDPAKNKTLNGPKAKP